MDMTLLGTCTISFSGNDLGYFDKETPVTFTAKDVIKQFKKTTSNKVIKERTVYTDLVVNVTCQWSKNRYEEFINNSYDYTRTGTLVIDYDYATITITNMSLTSESIQDFGGKSSIKCIFNCLDNVANINIVGKEN